MDILNINVEGHVLIKDVDSDTIVLNKRNAIHKENMSFAIASSLVNHKNNHGFEGFIYELKFGNGGVIVDRVGDVIYRKPRIRSITDTLYNETFSQVINNSIDRNINNNTTVVHEQGTDYSDIIVTCTLDYNEPVGQETQDTSDLDGTFVFDEMGLVSQQGRLLTHLIIHPVEKSSNRKFQIIYTVRILIG